MKCGGGRVGIIKTIRSSDLRPRDMWNVSFHCIVEINPEVLAKGGNSVLRVRSDKHLSVERE